MSLVMSDDWLTVHGGDNREVLRTLPAESVQCVVTSPPYWGLRDYGAPGQLGLEPTPEEYVATMVDVFREVRRVLRKDGTLWLNLGDSYASTAAGNSDETFSAKQASNRGNALRRERSNITPNLKPKDLVGIPWRVAFALQADGWYLRSDIVWSKLNPMPESVTDRPTKAHEYLFLLSKSERYAYDHEAIREPVSPNWSHGGGSTVAEHGVHVLTEGHAGHNRRPVYDEPKGANRRSVWTIATKPYPGAHFATFPEALVEPCILAGTSAAGACATCGAPLERVVERTRGPVAETFKPKDRARLEMSQPGRTDGLISAKTGLAQPGWRKQPLASSQTTGWRRTCAHEGPTVPCVVMDPFAGTGTVGLVANRLSRRATLIDLNPDYLRQCLERNRQTPLGLSA